MTELIIENDVGKKKLDEVLVFLKSRGIEAKVRQVSRKYKIIHKSRGLSDEELAEQLSGEPTDLPSCSEDDCHEIITRIPSSINLDNIQRIIDLIVYKEVIARSQATQDDVDRIAKEAKKGWWLANKDRFIK
jgi:hypothetical protein